MNEKKINTTENTEHITEDDSLEAIRNELEALLSEMSVSYIASSL